MRSIPAAMTWEVLARGGWYLLLATLPGIALPGMILLSLRSVGPLGSDELTVIILHLVMVYVSAALFGTAVFGAQGRVSQLYVYPLRSSAIVAWRLLPAMFIVFLQMVVCGFALNLLFEVNWPVWGPALTAAVTVAAIYAGAWLTDRAVGWSVVAMAVVGAVIGIWFRSRYGDPFSAPMQYWREVTAGDLLTLLAMAAASYWIAVVAVSRNRRGEPPISIGLMDRLGRLSERVWPKLDQRLDTPVRAFASSQWRQKGWAGPLGMLLIFVVGVTSWLVFSRDPAEALSLALAGGVAALTLLGFISGVLLGNFGPNDASTVMGHFLATRPISDAEMARATLRSVAKSVVLTWVIWAVSCAVVFGCIAGFGSGPSLEWPRDFSWWYLPFTLLVPWMTAGAFATLGLIGQPKFFLRLLFGLVTGLIAVSLTSKFLPPGARWLLLLWIFAIIGTALVVLGLWVFAAARRRGLIQAPAHWTCATAWIVGTLVIALQVPSANYPRVFVYLLISGIVALIFIPVAAAPLAISANRHR